MVKIVVAPFRFETYCFSPGQNSEPHKLCSAERQEGYQILARNNFWGILWYFLGDKLPALVFTIAAPRHVSTSSG